MLGFKERGGTGFWCNIASSVVTTLAPRNGFFPVAISHYAKRKDVGAGIEVLASSLLRRHVHSRSRHHSHSRQGIFVRGLVRCRQPIARNLGQTEIQDLDLAIQSDKNVCRLDVAMNDAFGMQRFQRFRNLYRDVEYRFHFEGLACLHPLFEALALQLLHDDKGMAVVVLDIVDGADVRVVQAGRRPRFAFEAVQRLAVADHVVRDELQGHMPAEAKVFSLINNAHASATDFPDDAIVGDRLADHEGPVGVMLGRGEREVNRL
jgi:hypothetical protein